MMEDCVMRRVGLFAVLCVFALAAAANATIIVPSIVSEANTNPYSTATTAGLNDNSGMTPGVNAGDSLESALAATHVFGGVFESWVTVGADPDYFGAYPPAEIVWDLTGGGNTTTGSAVLWQYQNDGGGEGRVGNHAKTIEFLFNTEAQGDVSFTGAATTIEMAPVMDGINAAQGFALPGDEARYVLMRVTDNHFGSPGIIAGGDRVGLGEVRFATEIIPEPATIALLGLGSLGLIRRRKMK